MTAMPDKVWYKEINSIEQWISERVTPSKEAVILQCVPTGEYADPTHPQNMRRELHWLTVVCPHCHREVDYLIPLSMRRGPIRIGCMKCNKLFVIAPEGSQTYVRHKWQIVALGLMPPFLRLSFFNAFWKWQRLVNLLKEKGC